MFTQEDLQALLAFEAEDAPVLSLYVNADPGQESRETIKSQIRGLLREAPAGLEQDIAGVENYFDLAHDWSKPGVALFSCHSQGFWQVYPTAVPFRNRLRIGHKPYVKPLAHLLDHYAHYGVIVVDRVGARFFEFHLGELQDSAGTMGEDIRKLKRGGGSSATGMRGGQSGGRAEEEAAQRNLREAAAAAADFFADKDIRRLFIAGTPETTSQFRENLPKRLQSCLAGTFPVEMTAADHEVRDRSLALLEQANTDREQRLVESLITAAAKGNQAVAGLEETLTAVSSGRVDTLILSDGFRQPGYIHSQSGLLFSSEADTAQFEQNDLRQVDDVIEAAVARTMEQGGRVEVIAENPELDAAGRIGALLRY